MGRLFYGFLGIPLTAIMSSGFAAIPISWHRLIMLLTNIVCPLQIFAVCSMRMVCLRTDGNLDADEMQLRANQLYRQDQKREGDRQRTMARVQAVAADAASDMEEEPQEFGVQVEFYLTFQPAVGTL